MGIFHDYDVSVEKLGLKVQKILQTKNYFQNNNGIQIDYIKCIALNKNIYILVIPTCMYPFI